LGGNSPKLTLKVENVSYYFSKADTHIFKVTPGTSSVSSFNIPFIVTQKGIKFYSDITLNGKNFRSFVESKRFFKAGFCKTLFFEA
jgi:hypothetical protein